MYPFGLQHKSACAGRETVTSSFRHPRFVQPQPFGKVLEPCGVSGSKFLVSCSPRRLGLTWCQ